MSSLASGLLAIALGALACGVSSADEPPLDSACLDCHGDALVPKIEGQNAPYLATQLRRFRDLHRRSFPMSDIASAFDDANVRSWADALAARAWREPQRAHGSATERRAGSEHVAAYGCRDCHGAALLGEGPIPRLAGQRAAYLERRLRAFAKGERAHVPLIVDVPLRDLDADEARAIAVYLASRRTPR